jgi:transcriptional regulator with XRE-family HTH domain
MTRKSEPVLTMTRMRARRLELGLSQRALAKRADVANADVSRFETGMGIPYESQAQRLARVLRLAPQELVELVVLRPLPEDAK